MQVTAFLVIFFRINSKDRVDLLRMNSLCKKEESSQAKKKAQELFFITNVEGNGSLS